MCTSSLYNLTAEAQVYFIHNHFVLHPRIIWQQKLICTSSTIKLYFILMSFNSRSSFVLHPPSKLFLPYTIWWQNLIYTSSTCTLNLYFILVSFDSRNSFVLYLQSIYTSSLCHFTTEAHLYFIYNHFVFHPFIIW